MIESGNHEVRDRGCFPDLRIGHGIDVHAFKDGDHVVIGGIRIPHVAAMDAWSDGDVLAHALCDALFGAAGLGDIGRHFPDTDPAYKGADSCELLREALRRVSQLHYRLINADCTVIAQAPRLAPYIEAMREKLAGILCIDSSHINIKATTSEGLGYTGRGEGIVAHAVVLLSLE